MRRVQFPPSKRKTTAGSLVNVLLLVGLTLYDTHSPTEVRVATESQARSTSRSTSTVVRTLTGSSGDHARQEAPRLPVASIEARGYSLSELGRVSQLA